MKPIAFFSVCWCLGAFGLRAGAQEIPRGYALERYAVIWQQSLFGFGTSGKAVPNASQYFSLAGVFRFKGGFGAVIVNRINGKIEQIETGSPSPGGFELLEVSGLAEDGPARVRVRKEGEVFWVVNDKIKTSANAELAKRAP